MNNLFARIRVLFMMKYFILRRLVAQGVLLALVDQVKTETGSLMLCQSNEGVNQ